MNNNLANIQLVMLLPFLLNIIRGTNVETENPSSSIVVISVDSQALIYHEGKFDGRTVKIQCKPLESYTNIIQPENLIDVDGLFDIVQRIHKKKSKERDLTDYLHLCDVLYIFNEHLDKILENVRQNEQEYFDMTDEDFNAFRSQESYSIIVRRLKTAYLKHLKCVKEYLNALSYGVCWLINFTQSKNNSNSANIDAIKRLRNSLHQYFRCTKKMREELIGKYRRIIEQYRDFEDEDLNFSVSLTSLAGYMTKENDETMVEIVDTIEAIILNKPSRS